MEDEPPIELHRELCRSDDRTDSRLPESPAETCPPALKWESMLVVEFPDGYVLHPSILDAIKEAAHGRTLVLGGGESHVRVWSIAKGETLAMAYQDAFTVEESVLTLLGLTHEAVSKHSVIPYQTVSEILEEERPLAPVISLLDQP